MGCEQSELGLFFTWVEGSILTRAQWLQIDEVPFVTHAVVGGDHHQQELTVLNLVRLQQKTN